MMIPRVGPVPPGIPTVRPEPGLGRPGPGGEPGSGCGAVKPNHGVYRGVSRAV